MDCRPARKWWRKYVGDDGWRGTDSRRGRGGRVVAGRRDERSLVLRRRQSGLAERHEGSLLCPSGGRAGTSGERSTRCGVDRPRNGKLGRKESLSPFAVGGTRSLPEQRR